MGSNRSSRSTAALRSNRFGAPFFPRARGEDEEGIERFELVERLEPLSAPGTPFTGGIIVRIRSFLGWAQSFRHISQVHSDARPSRRAAAHRIDQHVVGREKRGHFRMFPLPSFQTVER